MEFLMFVIGICIPSATVAYCMCIKEKRLERTDVNVMQHEFEMRRLEMEYEARVLALPVPPRREGDA